MRHKIRDKNLHVNTVTVFALVLLSPLPFLSPFSYDVQPVQALTFNNSPPSQESLPIIPTNVDNIGLIDIKFTPSLYSTANLHNDTDTGFFFNFISSISAIDIGDSVFVMTAAKTYDSRNIQFLNVTDPESIYANSNYNSYRIGYTEYENYNYALAIDTHPVKIDNFTYALVIIDGHDDLTDSLTSPSGQEYGNAIQILNITDLSKTTKAKYVSELNNTVGLVGASHAATVEIDGFTYALITSTYNHNVQIANITNVSDPDILSTITDGNAGYNVLGGASGIAAAQIDGSYYALVASIHDGSLTIINITNPASPSNVSAVINSTTYPRLYGAYDVASVEINNSHYALVASGTDSLTIINITNPALPSNVSTFSDDTTYSTSTRARGVSTVQLDGSYYAMITSQDNDGVQMINISIPSEPVLVYTVIDEFDGYTALAGAKDIATIQIKDANYSFVSSFADNAIQVIQHTFVADPDTIPIIITSNNTNKMYAKAGDNITVQIKLNATALNYNASILNETLSTHVINSGTVLNVSVIVPDYTIERNAMFNITVDHNANNLTITENDLRYAENVFVDTVSPDITLIGDTTHSVYTNTNPIIPGASATDKDPNYSGGYDVTYSDMLNTSNLGSVVNYTYTAHPDSAGNLGESKNRTITVVASPPIEVTSLYVQSFDTYLKKDDSFGIVLITNSSITNGSSLVYGTDNNTHVYPDVAQRVDFGVDPNKTAVFYPTILADLNGNITFSITVTSNLGRTEILTQDDITYSNPSSGFQAFIIADTIKPVITIIDASNNTVFQGNTYQDPGAEITDANNTSYDGMVSATTLDTSILGAQNITYTGLNATDVAGNVPDSITRTVTVLAKPLGIVTLTIEGNNTANSTKYAKLDDQITLNLTANGTISYAIIDIAGNSVSYAAIRNSTNASYIINSSFENVNGVKFNITAYNEDNTTSTIFTDENLTSSNLIIDTISPTITLQGNNSFLVYTNTPFTDPGAFAYDLSYGSLTINTTDTLNTSVPGTFMVNYKAPDDYAGNTGPSTTRTILVTDAPEINVTALIISSSSSNSFARAGQNITLMLYTDSSDLTNATGTLLGREFASSIANGNANFTIIVNSNDTNGNATFSITVTNSTTSEVILTKASITDDSFVTIDTIKPVITIIDASNNTVFQGNTYQDPGAEITDANNTSYDGMVSATTLDTSILGAQNITYTGLNATDVAGNVPDSITRTVTVLAKPLGIVTLTIEGNNTANSTKYAKLDDQITLNLTANGTISYAIIDIAGNSVSYAAIRNSTNASYIINSSFENVNGVKFNITAYNEDNTTSTIFTDENLTSSNLIIDTISPTITLQGNNSFLVYTNTPFTDPGAFAYDLSYGSLTINTTDTLNTSVPGTFMVNYKAPDDYAGNTGPTVTRTLTVQDAPPIDITALTIRSGNANSAYAKAGDLLYLTLVVNDTISTSNVQILNATITSESLDDKTLDLQAQISSNVTESNVAFTITITNTNEITLIVTEDDLTGPTVFIDTVSPRIELIGDSANYSIIHGTENPIILNVTTNDGDPNYSGNYMLSENVTVNANINGSAYNYTYIADADTAGNLGESVSRIITIVDAEPITVTSLSITSSTGNPNFANASKTITVTLETDGTDLGNFTGTLLGRDIVKEDVNSGTATFTTTVLSNDDNENATFSITVTNSTKHRILVTNADITDGSFVTIDTISPTITLNSENNIFVALGESYPYPGATAYDLSYENDMQISAKGNLNVNQLGDYILTYTAPTDVAGNIGQTITRTVTVLASLPINITTLTIEHNDNNNAVYAKEGDDLTITLVINYTIASYTATILDMVQPEAYPNSSTITLTVTVPSDPVEKNVTFSIVVIDVNGLPNKITQNNLASSNIFVDTIAPRIDLIGAKNYVVLPNSANPSIPNAVATDGDPNYTGNYSITTNGTLDTSVLNSVILYTYTAEPDSAGNLGSSIDRTVIVKYKSSSSSSSSPTIGKTSYGSRIVTNGFEYNGVAINADRYHTEFSLIETNVGDINTIKMKIYDSAGPIGIKRVELALGVPDIGLYHEAEAFVEVWMQRGNITVQEIIIIDDKNLLENSNVLATVSQTYCSEDDAQCLLVEIQYSYRDPPTYNTISIKPVNWHNNAHQFYFNDGIHVDGDSINLPKEIDISASHATSTTHAGETLHLVQIDRAEHLWVDQYGYHWKIIGNTVRQITVPEYLVPNDNTYGKLHGPDRNHPEFASSVYAEQKKAQETLAEILGHTKIIKPLPESGGTIYFDATGTDSRSSDSFKLLLELETARMQQLSNLLYDDSS